MNGQTNRETNTETINQRYCKEGEKTNKLTVIKKEIQAYLHTLKPTCSHTSTLMQPFTNSQTQTYKYSSRKTYKPRIQKNQRHTNTQVQNT